MTTLDLYSTSQTRLTLPNSHLQEKCSYGAPYIATQIQGRTYSVKQANCNHWDCPKHGILRAKAEYWRIVKGAEALGNEGKKLYFVTITTRGKSLSVQEAETQYLSWTNRLLTNLRQQTARHGGYWCYCQVTERQERRHPHSHILTTYAPKDLVEGATLKWEVGKNGKQSYWKDALRSDVLQSAVCSAGLGEQYDITEVRSASAVARYIGKYLFKQTLLTAWPKGWRRVRYSQNWPKEPQEKTDAFPLITSDDWKKLGKLAATVITENQDSADYVAWALYRSPTIVVKHKNKRLD